MSRLAIACCLALFSWSCGQQLAPVSPSTSSESGPPVGEIRIEPIEPEYGRHGWKLTAREASAEEVRTYVLGLTGSPGRNAMMSPEEWERHRERFENQPLAAFRFYSGKVLRVTYDLEWVEGELAVVLTVTDQDPPVKGSGGATAAYRFILDWSEPRPLDEIRWVASVGSLDVPEGGIDLIEWGNSKNTLRLARAEDWPD